MPRHAYNSFMRRLNLVVSDEAGVVLDTIKKEGGFKSLDNAMDRFLLDAKKELLASTGNEE
jgi:hypothetical protein